MSDVKKIEYDEHSVIIGRYNSGESLAKIAKIYNVHPTAIDYILKKHEIPKRSNKINSRKYIYDESFFEVIDTEEKAYWLGFIYADGYVMNKKDGGKLFGIALSIVDKEHLEKLKLSLKATYPIHEYIPNKSNYSNKNYCRIQIFGEKIFNDLGKYGVSPNKTLIVKPPAIDKVLYPHFIRGYIDGDGCITSSKKNTSDNIDFKVKILGTKELLDFIKEYIEENNVAIIHRYDQRKSTTEVFTLELGGNKQVKKFLDLIYKDAIIYLDRKYEKYLEL